mmetsp:Transcript_83013/g.189610  ORF Transcript_83013/g.189610 Transcript_83013/m.189610 type:complete len:124 (+) Transcript_83013:826-1197(+)
MQGWCHLTLRAASHGDSHARVFAVFVDAPVAACEGGGAPFACCPLQLCPVAASSNVGGGLLGTFRIAFVVRPGCTCDSLLAFMHSQQTAHIFPTNCRQPAPLEGAHVGGKKRANLVSLSVHAL